MERNNLINITIVYAQTHEQIAIRLQLPKMCCVRDAIERSGLLVRFPEIDLTMNKVGIFSRIATLDTALSEGDRVEIYRPLIIDPKQARRKRAMVTHT